MALHAICRGLSRSCYRPTEVVQYKLSEGLIRSESLRLLQLKWRVQMLKILKLRGTIMLRGYLGWIVFFALSISADSDSSREPTNENTVEEILVVGERFEIDTSIAFDRLTESNSKGARLYKQGKYKEALPYLLVGAKTGFKMSQARLGAIYLGGLGSVPKDLHQGIGWLGVASEPITSPEIRKIWKRVLSGVSESSREEVEAIVSEYVNLYGQRATGTACEMTSNTKSHVARLECTLDDEFHRFASEEHKALVGCFSGLPWMCEVAGVSRLLADPSTSYGGQGPF